jgi:ATP adenylyltransferase
MEHLWAPWRMPYIDSSKDNKEETCIFCDKPKEDRDVENLILYRSALSFIIMNKYPYNPGHLMVAPYHHTGRLEDLTDEERNELFAIVSWGVMLLKKVLNPDGLNIGINLGRVAGAGIEDHLHVHIVPRWNGDTNFMPVMADVRVVPQALADSYKRLKEQLP